MKVAKVAKLTRVYAITMESKLSLKQRETQTHFPCTNVEYGILILMLPLSRKR